MTLKAIKERLAMDNPNMVVSLSPHRAQYYVQGEASNRFRVVEDLNETICRK